MGTRCRLAGMRTAAAFAAAVIWASAGACRGPVLSSEEHRRRGEVYERNGKPWEAVREYGMALDRDPRNADLRLNLADLLVETGDYRGAERHYLLILKEDPGNNRAVNNLCWLYAVTERRLKWSEETMQPLADKPSPHQHSYLDTLGMIRLKRGKFKEAREAFRQAAALCRKGVVMSTSDECARISEHLEQAGGGAD